MAPRATQVHHIKYEPEETVKIFQGEHEILTKIQWYNKKSVSKGFLRALRLYIKESKDKAVEL